MTRRIDWSRYVQPRPRVEIVLPARAKQYERAMGEPLFCVCLNPRDESCPRSAEIAIAYRDRSELPVTLLCRACASELVEQLQSAIEMCDAMDDPRREAR